MAALPAFSTFSTKAGFAAEHITEVLLVGGGREGQVSDRPRNARARLARVDRHRRKTVQPWHRASSTRPRSVDGSTGAGERWTERNARQARSTRTSYARLPSLPLVSVSRPPCPRVAEASARVGALASASRRGIGQILRGVSRRERGRTACWCARRRASRRGRWWRRGKPSLRCLSCVEGEACADMRRAERAMGGRAFGKTRSARSSPKSPTLVGGF